VITPDGSRAYVGTFTSVTVIDTATNTVITTVADGLPCVTGMAITPAPLIPTSKDDCKDGGYKRFGAPAGPFRNQGQCVSFIESHSGGRD
jgi:YVTN family beta-propeller protein